MPNYADLQVKASGRSFEKIEWLPVPTGESGSISVGFPVQKRPCQNFRIALHLFPKLAGDIFSDLLTGSIFYISTQPYCVCVCGGGGGE